MQLHRGTENTLQEGVVQVLSDACSFCQSLFKPYIHLLRQTVQPQAIEGKDYQPDYHGNRQTKPQGLPKCGLNFERDRGFDSIPESRTVARDYSEAVWTRIEVRVDRISCGNRFTTILIVAIEPVLEPHALRN